MAGILDSVNQRTQLVGENRLEILMFRLTGRQLFAINVFKVQEVLQMPKLTLMPQRHRFVCGVVNLRGQTLPVIDLSQAIGMRPIVPDERSTIIVTEYNRSVQAFLVGGVERILNLNWESILPPPGGAGRAHYLTAITKVDDQIVEIIDVEKVLAEIVPYNAKVSRDKLDDPVLERARASWAWRVARVVRRQRRYCGPGAPQGPSGSCQRPGRHRPGRRHGLRPSGHRKPRPIGTSFRIHARFHI